MGSNFAEGGAGRIREISCAPEISEPLYALDVLIPIVDLHEESRCEIRRLGEDEAQPPPEPGRMSPSELWNQSASFTTGYHRFWWLMQALYALAGWFIVSLSILTFAQVNRTHAEPLSEHE